MELSPAVISKLPLGLLGFFGIKNGGQYPSTIGNVILPHLDMADILAANYHERLGLQSLITATGFNNSTVVATTLPAIVPASELWYLSHASIVSSTLAGDAVVYTPVVRNTQSGSASASTRALGDQRTQAASQLQVHPLTFVNGTRWLVPGDQIGIWTTSFTLATGINLSIQLGITRFPF